MITSGTRREPIKQYTGWFKARAIAINPDVETLNKIYGESDKREEPKYREDDKTLRIDFIVEEVNKRLKGKISFWLKSEFATKEVDGKKQDVFLNQYGFFAKSENEIQYKAYDGEQRLISFLKCLYDSKAGFKSSPDKFMIRNGDPDKPDPINLDTFIEELRKDAKPYLNFNEIWVRAFINESVNKQTQAISYFQNFYQGVSYGWSKIEGLDKTEDFFKESLKYSKTKKHIGERMDLALFINPNEKKELAAENASYSEEDEDELPF